MRTALGNDGLQVFPIEIRAIDRAVIRADASPHICPVDMAGFYIDDDAVREGPRLSNDRLHVRTVGIARHHPTTSQIQNEQAGDRRWGRGFPRLRTFDIRFTRQDLAHLTPPKTSAS